MNWTCLNTGSYTNLITTPNSSGANVLAIKACKSIAPFHAVGRNNMSGSRGSLSLSSVSIFWLDLRKRENRCFVDSFVHRQCCHFPAKLPMPLLLVVDGVRSNPRQKSDHAEIHLTCLTHPRVLGATGWIVCMLKKRPIVHIVY